MSILFSHFECAGAEQFFQEMPGKRSYVDALNAGAQLSASQCARRQRDIWFAKDKVDSSVGTVRVPKDLESPLRKMVQGRVLHQSIAERCGETKSSAKANAHSAYKSGLLTKGEYHSARQRFTNADQAKHVVQVPKNNVLPQKFVRDSWADLDDEQDDFHFFWPVPLAGSFTACERLLEEPPFPLSRPLPLLPPPPPPPFPPPPMQLRITRDVGVQTTHDVGVQTDMQACALPDINPVPGVLPCVLPVRDSLPTWISECVPTKRAICLDALIDGNCSHFPEHAGGKQVNDAGDSCSIVEMFIGTWTLSWCFAACASTHECVSQGLLSTLSFSSAANSTRPLLLVVGLACLAAAAFGNLMYDFGTLLFACFRGKLKKTLFGIAGFIAVPFSFTGERPSQSVGEPFEIASKLNPGAPVFVPDAGICQRAAPLSSDSLAAEEEGNPFHSRENKLDSLRQQIELIREDLNEQITTCIPVAVACDVALIIDIILRTTDANPGLDLGIDLREHCAALRKDISADFCGTRDSAEEWVLENCNKIIDSRDELVANYRGMLLILDEQSETI